MKLLNTLALLAVVVIVFVASNLFHGAAEADKADRQLHEEIVYSMIDTKVSDLQRMLAYSVESKVDNDTLDETWRVCSSVKRVSPNSKAESELVRLTIEACSNIGKAESNGRLDKTTFHGYLSPILKTISSYNSKRSEEFESRRKIELAHSSEKVREMADWAPGAK
jgi:hypothetical protein